ncbi:uncharacterized protein LOC127241778 [Andrographis paniculata]|uniref:uncharacterized protein LOC127241778 n=1 Tax=Andrographis paniculata TaxID=175694 RepID=UPI0021E78788|nr:uncharacterized protein LOC127241778 [Andrographis paniculata]
MDFWRTARSFAEDAAKKSQALTQGLAAANLSNVVFEASKRSKELAAEATKKSKEFAAEALKRADEIAVQIPPPAAVLSDLVDVQKSDDEAAADPEKFGVTDELRQFVQGITTDTFRNFPVGDDSEVADIPTVANVRQDLTEWQEKHAKLVVATVKEISKLRYQLCPRLMKERTFWRVYFNLVNSYVAPYEKRYMDEVKLREATKAQVNKTNEVSSNIRFGKADENSKTSSNNLKPISSDKDLDVFLLGDFDDNDDSPDDGSFDDDFYKL